MSETDAHSTSESSKRAEFEEEALVHLGALYGLGLRLTGGDEARAEDLVQEAVLKAWRSWHTYERGTNCRAWLMTILRNTFVNEFRQRKRRPTPVDYDDVEERPIWGQLKEEDPEGEFFESVVDDEVVEAVEDLPDEFRVTLVLSDVDGMSYDEISDQLGIPVGTVKSRLYRARRRLQNELYDYAVSMGYLSGNPMGDREGVLARLRDLISGPEAGSASRSVPSPPYGEDEMPEGCEETEEISCREAAERVYEYLDGELGEERAEEVRCHVEKCKRCYPLYDWERMFLDFVRSRADREEPNPELRRKVEALLDREEEGD